MSEPDDHQLLAEFARDNSEAAFAALVQRHVNLVYSAALRHPDMVEMRERLARQAPDGTWNRIYGLADGSVQTAASNDGNFAAWEKVNTYSPPVGQ